MLVREKITGRAPPRSAENIVDLWRDWIEERAGEAFRSTGISLDDQDAFARATRDLIANLEMADELGSDQHNQDDDSSDDEEQPGTLPTSGARKRAGDRIR